MADTDTKSDGETKLTVQVTGGNDVTEGAVSSPEPTPQGQKPGGDDGKAAEDLSSRPAIPDLDEARRMAAEAAEVFAAGPQVKEAAEELMKEESPAAAPADMELQWTPGFRRIVSLTVGHPLCWAIGLVYVLFRGRKLWHDEASREMMALAVENACYGTAFGQAMLKRKGLLGFLLCTLHVVQRSEAHYAKADAEQAEREAAAAEVKSEQ